MPYKDRYGAWAGNEKGHKPDLIRCCESVYSNNSHISSQCGRKRGYGPNKAYCKQHDPEAVRKRGEASMYAYYLKAYNDRIRYYGMPLTIIKQIAGGHNDPRSLCQEWLNENEERLTPPAKPDWME